MKNRCAKRRRSSMCALVFMAGGCAADNAGQRFRTHLSQIVGQPVRVLVDDLGPSTPFENGANRGFKWGYVTMGSPPFRECEVEVLTDLEDRILKADMRGSDYDCGLMLLNLRERQARYQANPGLREREARERELRMKELIGLRQQLNEADPN